MHVLSLYAILPGSISIKRLLDTAYEHAKKDIPNRDTKQQQPSGQKAQKPYCSWRFLTPYLPTYHSSRNLACIALLDTCPKGPVSSKKLKIFTLPKNFILIQLVGRCYLLFHVSAYWPANLC